MENMDNVSSLPEEAQPYTKKFKSGFTIMRSPGETITVTNHKDKGSALAAFVADPHDLVVIFDQHDGNVIAVGDPDHDGRIAFYREEWAEYEALFEALGLDFPTDLTEP